MGNVCTWADVADPEVAKAALTMTVRMYSLGMSDRKNLRKQYEFETSKISEVPKNLMMVISRSFMWKIQY